VDAQTFIRDDYVQGKSNPGAAEQPVQKGPAKVQNLSGPGITGMGPRPGAPVGMGFRPPGPGANPMMRPRFMGGAPPPMFRPPTMQIQ
jgi:hypothetical protein